MEQRVLATQSGRLPVDQVICVVNNSDMYKRRLLVHILVSIYILCSLSAGDDNA